MSTPSKAASASTPATSSTFYHYFGRRRAKARIWVDSEGRPGGIVAESARIHPTATIGDRAEVGPRTIIEAGAFIACGVTIGKCVIIRERARIFYGATIGEDVHIGESTSVGPYSVIGKDACIGRFVRIGLRAIIGERSTIDSRSVIEDDTMIVPNSRLTGGFEVATTKSIDAKGRKVKPIVAHRDDNGLLHCEGGPALILSSGAQYWYRHGTLHREDGPAAILPDGTHQYWLSNMRVSSGELPDLTAPDTLGYRVWCWDPKLKRVRSPLWNTPWHVPELRCEIKGDLLGVENKQGIHAWRPIRGDWRTVDPLRSLVRVLSYRDEKLIPVTGIVERYGRAAIGSLGWRAEWVHIRELLVPAVPHGPNLVEQLREAYPEVQVHQWKGEGGNRCQRSNQGPHGGGDQSD